MTVSAWRIATDTPDYTADDLSGAGARQTGGRWNRNSAVVYAASSIALACLETIVHLGMPSLPLNRYLVRLDIPLPVWKRATVFDAAAHVGWDAVPPGKVSLDFGERWLAKASSAILLVPSSIVPEENNILVHPGHPETPSIRATKLRRFFYDARLA